MCLRILCGKTEREDAFFFFLFFSSPGCNSLCRQIGHFFFQSLASLFKHRARARTRESRSLNDDKTETHERALEVALHHLSQRGGARKRQREDKKEEDVVHGPSGELRSERVPRRRVGKLKDVSKICGARGRRDAERKRVQDGFGRRDEGEGKRGTVRGGGEGSRGETRERGDEETRSLVMVTRR